MNSRRCSVGVPCCSHARAQAAGGGLAGQPLRCVSNCSNVTDSVLLVDFALELRKHLANGRVPPEFSFVNQHPCHGGGHGFGAGTNVKLIGHRHGSWLAFFPHPDGCEVANLSVLHNHCGERRQLVFFAESFQHLMQVAWRWFRSERVHARNCGEHENQRGDATGRRFNHSVRPFPFPRSTPAICPPCPCQSKSSDAGTESRCSIRQTSF